MEREEILGRIYQGQREETRLTHSRHGQLEYLTTMDYIRRLVPHGSKILEVGAGTGRYSVALAGTDSVLELAEEAPAFHLSDEDFRLFAAYHLKTCETRELLGSHSHLLYIGRKDGQR